MGMKGQWVAWLGASALSLVAVGCDAQVGEEYTGEVMLEIRGRVVDAERAEDMVPVFAFLEVVPSADEDRPDQRYELVDGDLRGIFPSNFSLRLSAPPAAALREGMAGAFLALVPRDHPRFFDLPSYGGELWEEDLGDGRTLEHDEDCTSSGRCIVRESTCTVQPPCEVILREGEPDPPNCAWNEVGCAPAYSGWQEDTRIGDTVYVHAVSCTHRPDCLREVLKCDVSAPGAKVDGDVLKVCTETSRSGDLPSFDELGWFKSNVNVAYTMEDRPASGAFPAMTTGYNVLQFVTPQSEEEVLAQARCTFEANVATEAANARGQTPPEWPCTRVERISDPASVLLDLSLSRESPLDAH